MHGLSPLHQAVLAKSPEMAEVLLRAGADVLARDSNGLTAYKLAKRFLCVEIPASRDVLVVLQQWIKALPSSASQIAAGMSSTSVLRNEDARSAAAAEVDADVAAARGVSPQASGALMYPPPDVVL